MSVDFPSVFDFLNLNKLPAHEIISSLANQASEVLENEISPYREGASNGNPGSLLMLQSNGEIPSIIIPDLHARPKFLENILNFKLPLDFCYDEENSGFQITVYEALAKKLINVICVGDAIHSELTGPRWQEIQKEFEAENFCGNIMQEEMADCLSLLCAIMTLKMKFPQNFHFLKGNHENIMNENCGGDYAFCKYADEGEMVKKFVSAYYGDDVLYLISCWEKALPLIAAGSNFVVSHAEPMEAFTKSQLIDARFSEKVVNGLIWTKNDEVHKKTVEPIMEELLNCKDRETLEKCFYFGGHRPVYENFALRQNGKYIQIHNPRKQNIALVYFDKVFDPEKHIVGVNNE